jgi:uncharacterized repeat protein (TIGR03837 family)
MRPRRSINCDLFCQVIDNFGDAGVCWRLARQLSVELGWRVRLFVDRVDVLRRIAPESSATRDRSLGSGIATWEWPDHACIGDTGDVVIEAFACRLPDAYVQAMGARPKVPVWINLEYLSAEDWVEACHGLPSPDPSSGLIKYFFFPGFTQRTGGLIREQSWKETARSFQSQDVRRAFLASLGVSNLSDVDLPVSVFCYPESPITSLISIAESTRPTLRRPLWLVPESVARFFPELAARKSDRFYVLPFLSQDDYDRLLLSCDLNFVRGEDSFVRAQLAARPFVWQAYRQSGDAHRQKVDAFLARFLSEADKVSDVAARQLFQAWNGFVSLDEVDWRRYCLALGKISEHCRRWQRKLESVPSLAEKLVQFCESRL